MASRTNFYFRQKVTEAELDLAFELLEQADRHLATDIGIYGIIRGAEPTPHEPLPDLQIDLTAPAKAYDRLGQRIFFGTGQAVDCSVDFTGLPTEVSTSTNERWVGVFLKFDRLLSDPRTDGNSQEMFFRRDESFSIVVRQAAEAPLGSNLKVPLVDSELLVCDVRRTAGQSQILAADLDTSRRQAFIFARGDAVSVVSGLWNILAPQVSTVQAALDSVDTELADHFDGSSRRHLASAVDYTPHGFVGAENTQAAIDEIVDGLSSATSGAPGAARIGADAATGTPHALPAGNVDGQLSQLLAWLNTHLGATSGAHNASAISALAHNHISSPSVQAQLQEIVEDLQSQSASLGAAKVGSAAVSGTPSNLVAGTVRDQITTLLAALNSHQKANSDAHPASAVSVTDSSNRLAATEVQAAIVEILEAFEIGHYRDNEVNSGNHRTILQPVLGSGMVLLFESRGVGGPSGRLRLLADTNNVWFTLNAAYDTETSKWFKDNGAFNSCGFRMSCNELALLNTPSYISPFNPWSNRWTLPMASTINSALELSGSVQELGRLGCQATNTSESNHIVGMGGAVTFRNRFATAPSSITLAQDNASASWAALPIVSHIDRDGFGFFSFQTVADNATAYWFGRYMAIA